MTEGVPEEEEEAWCERCMAVVHVVERFDDVIQEYRGQRGVMVTQYDCDHNVSIPDGTFYPFP